MSVGRERESCGLRREAEEVFGISANAVAKSWAVGVVRRDVRILVLTVCKKSSMYSSTAPRNISSALGFAVSNPASVRAAEILLSSCPWMKTGSWGANSVCAGRFWTC